MNSFKNNRLLPVLTILLLVVNIITLAMLWMNKKAHDENGQMPPPGPVFEFVTKELNLNEHQQEQYKALRQEHQQLQRPLADSIAKAKDAFFELLKHNSMTDSELVAYNRKTLDLQGQLELVNFKHFQKLRAICNEQQQQKFDAVIQTVLKRLANQRAGARRPPPQGTEDGRDRRPPPGEDGPPPGENGPPPDK